MASDPSKTEKATPKKRRDERKKGHVFLSRDAVSVATLLGSFSALLLMAGLIAEQVARFMVFCISVSQRPGGQIEGMMPELGIQAILVLVKTVCPIILVTILCAVVATFAQTRFLVSFEPLKPNFSKLNPIQGFKKFFSLQSVVETLKSILKISVLLIIIYISVEGAFQESSKYFYTDIMTAGRHIFDIGRSMIFRILIAFIALAAGDLFYQWWNYERQMRMSKHEIKEEFKQMEGDPKIKSKIRQIQQSRAMSRMMQQVPGADVVIRNPSHFAVALRYKPNSDNAPVVLAKGQDELALRIVRVAEEHQVAVIENVPLARALYAQTELNQEIPPDLYGAVAEVLVYIFRLNDRKQIVK